MNNTCNRLMALLAGSFLTSTAAAHEGHDHAKKTDPEKAEVEMRAREVCSTQYEVLLKFDPSSTEQDRELMLFISDFATNRPAENVQVAVYRSNNPEMAFEAFPASPGTWHIHAHDLSPGIYDINVAVRSGKGEDMLLIEAVDFRPQEASVTEPHEHSHAWMYFTGAGILLAGFVAGRWLRRRPGAVRMMMMALLLGLLPQPLIQRAAAGYESSGHEPESHSGNTVPDRSEHSAAFYVAKETQFLMDVRTIVAGDSSFDSGRRLYGTIIPSGQGLAAIIAPYAGMVTSVRVKPGDRVQKGQVLLTLDKQFDAAAELAYQAEKNRLQAELANAKLAYDRLMSVSDIAAGKDIDQARARLQVAEDNHKLFETGGRGVQVEAPIAGVVSPFSLSAGMQVSGGQSLFRVSDLAMVYVECQAYEPDMEVVAEASRFMMKCAQGDHQTTEVALLSAGQEFNPTNQSQKVLFEVKNEKAQFKLGEFVHVWAYTNQRNNKLSIPNDAIKEIEGRPVVFVKNAAEEFELRYIALGENNGTATAVRSGIAEGERVVTEGAYQIKLVYLNR